MRRLNITNVRVATPAGDIGAQGHVKHRVKIAARPVWSSVAATTATKANASWCCATKPCATNSTRVGKRTAQIVAQGSIAAVLSEAKHAMDTAVRSTHSAQQRNELQQPAV